jgi:hypothetical protein
MGSGKSAERLGIKDMDLVARRKGQKGTTRKVSIRCDHGDLHLLNFVILFLFSIKLKF